MKWFLINILFLTMNICQQGKVFSKSIKGISGRSYIEEAILSFMQIIPKNGVLYPIEIKLTTLPKANMASEFDILDGIPEKKREWDLSSA